ncbi:MAG: tRNA lysidine(34) synthetase TilS [Candidatus Firestonebacteria bacterium RIFOXYC2_FULL_39_67]|nr:MAG: tRNA lysidine(34) synthetase TilS [Candidatus Firestonebacteria bacterium RIFOXYD2_FULL_39_29]OGF54808.1 MAG: tRNA lysidine(34) synthetase TilS [Candidatus Firestonebacteria bacterium RifOxyC12_full_39_7]OGF55255.1 MAG: tRNA lysidine(34) synthetase TilS [Candidatus Firestonebacteria bacterium RIFOXYC2_FULL_39_67]
MHERVIAAIEKNNLLRKGDTVLAALSGGPDSTALLLVLHEIKSRYDLKIFAVHINYHLRGSESIKDENFAGELCLKLKIPFAVYSFETRKIIKKRSLQDFARELRYQAFIEEAKKVGAGKIAVAHNKNDRVETILMRLLRGSHTAGLSGMPIKRKLSENTELVRPLFDLERNDIEDYLKKKNIKARTDKSNLKTDYLRNKIRLKLLPLLKKEYNPKIEENLLRLAAMSSLDEAYIFGKAKKYIKEKNNEYFVQSLTFEKAPLALRYRILRELIRSARGNLKGVENKHLSDVIAGKKSVAFPGGLLLLNTGGKLVAVNKKNGEKQKVVRLKIPGFSYFGNFRVAAEVKGMVKCFGSRKDAYFDTAKLNFPLSLRERQAGDRFVPFGMRSFKKLQDYMVNEKIPKYKRETIPLVTDRKGNILWVAGYRTDERFKVKPTTKRVLHLNVKAV